MILFFTSCKEGSYSFNEPIESITSIEIVNAVDSFDYTVEKTLSETETENFLESFQTIEFYGVAVGDPVSFHGIGIKISYESGNYEMITHFSSEYIENGTLQHCRKYCNEQTFNKLLEEFN